MKAEDGMLIYNIVGVVFIFIILLTSSFVLRDINLITQSPVYFQMPDFNKLPEKEEASEPVQRRILVPDKRIVKQEETRDIEPEIIVKTELVYVPQIIEVPKPVYIPAPPAPEKEEEEKQEQINEEPMGEPTLEVISPIPGKGLGREYLARDGIKDEFNYIELALIVRDSEGNAVKNAKVDIKATDSSQNKTLEGTGNVVPIYLDGTKQFVPAYPFHYEFKTAGKHTITFTADLTGIDSEIVSLDVEQDERE